MKKDEISRQIRALTLAGMLAAMSVVIGIFCKNILNFGDGLFRITFENFPIILSGMLFGPIIGGAVGIITDLLSYLLSFQSYPPNLIVTLGAAIIGVISGLIPKFLIKKRGVLQTVITAGTAHIIGSMIIKSIGLFQFYSWAVLFRIPTYIGIALFEILIISLLFKNGTFKKLIDSTDLKKDVENRTEMMTYDEALKYIHDISWTFCKPGLERISALCERLGNPQADLKFVHIAGTNGKGSFSSMLDSVLRAAGYKTGLYTSPYIVEFCERMRVNGENIPKDELARITSEVKPIADAMEDKPTEFELITAIAFLYFKRQNCDVVILEAGMGGRLDSTNIIENPLLSVITGVALDHTAFLGDTVEKIAKEKAGIIKAGAPVLYGGESDEAYKIIKAEALRLGSDITRTDRAKIEVSSYTLESTELSYGELKDIKIGLLGSYQPCNAANVIEAVYALRNVGMDIPDSALREGLALAKWPARFEIIHNREVTVIFDGAHNPEGVRYAKESVKKYFGDKKVVLVTGLLRDKDYELEADLMKEISDIAYTITPTSERALSAEDYKNVLTKHGFIAYATSSPREALSLAMEKAKAENTAVVCLGSLYVYSEIISALDEINKENI